MTRQDQIATGPTAGPRVLFVNRMASLERGGGETFDLEISRHLEPLGATVSYLSGRPVWTGPRTPIDHPRAHLLRTPYTGWFPWDKVRGGWRLRVWDYACFERAAARWIASRAAEFDVVQACELPLLVFELKRRRFPRPVVMRVTAPNVYDPWQGMAQADAVIASGTSMAKLRAGPRPDCVEVPNGVDVTRFRPQPSTFRASHGIAADECVLLYVARFQDFKNHRVLVEALATLRARLPAGPRLRLVLAGSGPLRARVEAQAAAAGLSESVLFLGEVSFTDLPAVYAAADVMAISSDYESFCFAAIEAMASGLPVVSTDCGWVPNLLGRPAGSPAAAGVERVPGGWVTPVGQAGPLADALAQAVADPAARRAIGLANRAAAEQRHTWIASAEKLIALYRRLTAAGRGGA